MKKNVKLDTGAQCNVLPLQVYEQISSKPRKRSKSRLVSYSGHKLDTVGKATLLVSTKDKYVPVEFEIVKNKSTQIFGLKTCLELNLISRLYSLNNKSATNDEILENYSDVFEGLGCLSTEYQIRLDKDAKPVVCLDPRDLNKSILRENYPMKTVEEVAAKVNNAKVYSVLDASKGYWQIKLTKDSQKYITFNTPFGRYKYLRLPFEIKSSSEVFQRTVSQILENLEGCEVIADGILVWEKGTQEHNERLCTVLERIRQANMKLNKAKCKIGH